MAKKKDEKQEEQNEETESNTPKSVEILRMYAENPNISYKEIAQATGASENYVAKVIWRYRQKIKEKPPEELQPLDEMEYLRRIIASTWATNKAELIISLFQDHDPNDLRILYNLLNKAQCPKTAAELIIYSWAKHRHIPPERVKEMFKDNKSMLRTFRQLGYFEDVEDEEEEEEEEKSKKEEEPESIEQMVEEIKREKLKELKRRLEELRLEKEMREMERQLKELETKDEPVDMDFKWDEGPAFTEPVAPQPVTRKVVRPTINPVTGEVLRDENGNIIFETIEEPVNGPAAANPQDDMMRWMLAMQQTKKEDPEKELLKKELEELKRKIEEEERRKKEEEERKRYEEQIRQMQEQMQKFQEQVMQMIQQLQQNTQNSAQKTFEQELLLKLLSEKDKVPPEVMQIIQEEREIIKKLQERPKDDEEKKLLMQQIDELKKTLEKKEMEEMFGKYNQVINALYQKIESLEKEMSKKTALSDEKYKVDKIIEMDQQRLATTKEMIKETTQSIIEPTIKMIFESQKQQDMWNKYMMLLQEEQRRGLPPGTLTDRFFGSTKVTEDEKRKLLEKIDKEMQGGA